MLVDGSRVPERIVDGTRDFVDLDFIKQVEIVRGPGSVLWGTDALGGIVAFETLDPEDLLVGGKTAGGRASVSYDSFNNGVDTSFVGAAQISPDFMVLAGISYDVAEEGNLSKARADGGLYGCPRNVSWGATPCNEFDPTDMDAVHGLFKLVATPADGHRFEISADIMNRVTDVQYDQVLGPQYSSVTGRPTGEIVHGHDRTLDLTRQRFAIEHDWTVAQPWLDSLKWTFAYAPQSYERTGVKRTTAANGRELRSIDELSYGEDFFEFDLQLVSAFEAMDVSHVLTYGFDGDIAETDYERQDTVIQLATGATTVSRAGGFNFANVTTTRADFFVQDEISLFGGRLDLLPGLRYATYNLDPRPDADYQAVPGKEPREIRDSALTAKVGAMLHLDDRFSVYGSYGQGFKMPTGQQLFTSLPGTSFNLIPAPDLQPEAVDSYEIGLRGQFSKGWFSINGFYADYDDFIQSFYNPPGTTDYTYRNLSVVEIWGIEASAEVELARNLKGSLSLSWQEGTQIADPDADEVPFDVAPFTATVGLAYQIPDHGLEFRVESKLAAAVDRTSDPDLFRPDGYAVIDAYATWQPTERVKFKVSALNVFDERYFEAPFPNTYTYEVSDAVARTNPLELQTAPGRTYRVGLDLTF